MKHSHQWKSHYMELSSTYSEIKCDVVIPANGSGVLRKKVHYERTISYTSYIVDVPYLCTDILFRLIVADMWLFYKEASRSRGFKR